MAGYSKNPRVQSQMGFAATMLQTELHDFGVHLNGQKNHYDLTRLIISHGEDAVRAVAMKALDRYTEGVDGTQGQTAEEYVMERLRQYNWSRNNHQR